jgi:hypothetical protein
MFGSRDNRIEHFQKAYVCADHRFVMLPLLLKSTVTVARVSANVLGIIDTHIRNPQNGFFTSSDLKMCHLTYFLFYGVELCHFNESPSHGPLENNHQTWSYPLFQWREGGNKMADEQAELAFAIVAFTRADYLAKQTSLPVSEFLALALRSAFISFDAISKSISSIRSRAVSAQSVLHLSICLYSLSTFVMLGKKQELLRGCEGMANHLLEFLQVLSYTSSSRLVLRLETERTAGGGALRNCNCTECLSTRSKQHSFRCYTLSHSSMKSSLN